MIPIVGRHEALNENREVNLLVAIGFLGQAVRSLRGSETARDNGNSDQLVTKGTVGLFCLGQGLELLFKAILLAKNISEPKGKRQGSHPLIPMYELVLQDQGLHEALLHLFVEEGCSEPAGTARSIVGLAENGFSTARYFGLGNHNELCFPKARLVALMVFALIATTFAGYSQYVAEEMELPLNLSS